ncbi:hypothetical protein [Ligilactobacillus equi]|uniref:Uncharacterized protein n=1 Tax=Ligilactobacillus equi DSM 15833 = JCM 10991 TaxID=1423740 RepID=A0A0R1TCZ2_9LACO|nr:hypothetical protein [Ligilactobacillus equi]KRL79201.1 hypothetical protein FC36_GL000854 [Ligilactobacillus equi DSM 15833 = JCM 10991]
MASSSKYASLVAEELSLFQDIIALKTELLNAKSDKKNNDHEVRIWRNSVRNFLRLQEGSRITEDITVINYDLRRVAMPAVTLEKSMIKQARETYNRGLRRVESLVRQVTSLTYDDAENIDKVSDELSVAKSVIFSNLSAMTKFVRKINQSPIDRKKMSQTMSILNSYANVPCSNLYSYKVTGKGEKATITFTPNRDVIISLLKRADAMEFYPKIPFNNVSSWADDYAKDTSGRPVTDYVDDIYKELVEAKELFESDPNYWRKDNLKFDFIELPEVPDVEQLIPSANVGMPENVIVELGEYSRGSFQNTYLNVPRINELAYTYNSPSIEFKQPRHSKASEECKSLLLQLTDILNQFGTRRTKKGYSLKIWQSTVRLLQAQDKGYIALNNAFSEFEADVDYIKTWVNSSWYQFGGIPENDNAFNGRGNASKWQGKKWY